MIEAEDIRTFVHTYQVNLTCSMFSDPRKPEAQTLKPLLRPSELRFLIVWWADSDPASKPSERSLLPARRTPTGTEWRTHCVRIHDNHERHG